MPEENFIISGLYLQQCARRKFHYFRSVSSTLCQKIISLFQVYIFNPVPEENFIISGLFLQNCARRKFHYFRSMSSTLKTLQMRFGRVHPQKNCAAVLLQHDNARPHKNMRTQEAITKIGRNALHPSPLHPRRYSLRFLLLWSRQRCHQWEKTWE